jgi:hypothetical protein
MLSELERDAPSHRFFFMPLLSLLKKRHLRRPQSPAWARGISVPRQ